MANLVELIERRFERWFVAHHATTFPHHSLHRIQQRSHGRAITGAPVSDRGTTTFNLRRIQRGRGVFGGETTGVFANDPTKHHNFGQAVAAQTVRAVNARRHFARRVQAWHCRRVGFRLDAHTAHRIMSRRRNLHRLAGDVHANLAELRQHAWQARFDLRWRQMTYIEPNAAVGCAASADNFGVICQCHTVTG